MKNALLVAALALSLGGCRPSGAVSPHSAVGNDASTLRESFNASAQKTRVIALVSPS